VLFGRFGLMRKSIPDNLFGGRDEAMCSDMVSGCRGALRQAPLFSNESVRPGHAAAALAISRGPAADPQLLLVDETRSRRDALTPARWVRSKLAGPGWGQAFAENR